MSTFTQHNRRDFIKMLSAGAASSFFTLPSRNAFGQTTKAPLRFLTLIDTYGIPTANRSDIWISSSAGDYALEESHLGTILEPLKAYIDNMMVISNISLDSRSQTRDSTTHHYLTAHTLTGSSALQDTRGDEAGFELQHASVDVHIGRYLDSQYGLASPRIYDHLFFTDYEQRDSATFCYTQSGVQKRSIAGALNVRNALFDANVSDDVLSSSIANQARIDAIALVTERLNTMSSGLSRASHAEVITAYQESVNSVSQELNLKNESVFTMPNELNSVINGGRGEEDNLPNMFKNIYHAFAFDMVSSVTYAFGGEKINQLNHGYLYNEAEHNDREVETLLQKNYHSPSHRTDDTANKVHEIVRTFQAQELATLLDRLSTTLDDDGSTMLDNTVVFFTSQMSNNTHNASEYPLLVIAGKNTNLQGGFHYDCGDSTNNDLLTTLAQGMTLPDDNFGGHDRNGEYVTALNNGAIRKLLKS